MVHVENQTIDLEETLTFFLCSLTDQQLMDASTIAIYNGWTEHYKIYKVPSGQVVPFLKLIEKFKYDDKTREALRCMQYYS